MPVGRKQPSAGAGGSGTGTGTNKCHVSKEGTVCLSHILESFHGPIREEHAWALCYQCAKCFSEAVRRRPERCRAVTHVSHVHLHTDGTVHPSTVLFPSAGDDATSPDVHDATGAGAGAGGPSGNQRRRRRPDHRPRRPRATETELVVGLGVVVFNALDMGYGCGEERAISRDLEHLIELMASADEGASGDDTMTDGSDEAHQETDDEGIERDSGDAEEEPARRSGGSGSGAGSYNLELVMEECSRRVHGGSGASATAAADQHYRAVCRALVAEALELATFLEHVSVGARDLAPDGDLCRELDRLDFQDWARFWVQVIGELRMGVQLKKVCHSRTPIEYQLTPYEILMDDIRSRRYTLKKIMVEGTVPTQRVRKDAHAVILEFIRSRPPLRKVSERQLAPLQRAPTLREQLLDSIKRGRTLRPTSSSTVAAAAAGRPSSGVGVTGGNNAMTTTTTDGNKPPVPAARRLIKVDFSMLQGDDDDDDDDEEERETEENGVEVRATCPTDVRMTTSTWCRTGSRTTTITQDEYHRFCDTALESYDLATQCPSRRASARRHTLGTCAVEHGMGAPGTQSVPQSRPASRQSHESSETDSAQLGAVLPEMSWSRSSLQDELIQSKQWQEALSLDDRLSLTLEEIVHIRSVLTKAELEALPVEGHVKEDAEKRKICFLCLKTRFGLFGPWGQRCKLCKRTVCSKCYTKMRIPTEHFSNVPVVLLSPSLMSSPEDESKDSFPRSLMSRLMVPDVARNTVGSAPSSPNMSRGAGGTGESCSAPGSRVASSLGNCSDATCTNPSPVSSLAGSERRNRMARARTLGRPADPRTTDRLKGMQMIVCHDCKIMVIQIIKSSRTSRSVIRNNAIRNLTLNLSPVY